MSQPEFSRRFDVRQCEGKQVALLASADERAALARRFELVRLDRLEANLTLTRHGRDVAVTGTIDADFVQSCAVSAEDLPVSVSEPVAFRFVPEVQAHSPDEEIEFDADDCDEIEYSGSEIDAGEAVAQSLALAIDPFATGPDAEEARAHMRSLDDNPFAALANLKKDKNGEDGA